MYCICLIAVLGWSIESAHPPHPRGIMARLERVCCSSGIIALAQIQHGGVMEDSCGSDSPKTGPKHKKGEGDSCGSDSP